MTLHIGLKGRFQGTNRIQKFDGFIKEIVSIFEVNGSINGRINISKFSSYELVLIDGLINFTNFLDVFNILKINYADFKNSRNTILFAILSELKKSNVPPTFDNFLTLLNKKIDAINNITPKNYDIYVPLRLKFSLNLVEIKQLKKLINKVYGLSTKNPSKRVYSKVGSKKLEQLFKSRSLILKKSYIARDIYFILTNQLEEDISSFLGCIYYANHAFMDTNIWRAFPGDYSLEEDITEQYLIALENKKKISLPEDPILIEADIKDSDINIIGKKQLVVHNMALGGKYNELIRILSLMSKHKPEIRLLLKQTFSLYYSAITEKSLEISFLKFWVIAESIIKKNKGGTTDKYFLKIITRIFSDKYQRELISVLYNKRNELVHEFKLKFISQTDRNTIKGISELIIHWILEPPIKIKDIEELNILLESITLSKENILLKKRILGGIYRQYKP